MTTPEILSAWGFRMCERVKVGVILGLYWENGKENGSYYLGFWVKGLGFIVPLSRSNMALGIL